jgi:hypothetical protein
MRRNVLTFLQHQLCHIKRKSEKILMVEIVIEWLETGVER